MNVRLDAIVADIAWLADTMICVANEHMHQLSAEHRLTVILERLQSDQIIVDGNEHAARFCPGPCVGDDIKRHGVEDEVVTIESLPAVSLLVDEYRRFVNAFDGESISGVVWLVSQMFRMLADGWVENCGRAVSGVRNWRATEKARELGVYHGLDVPVGPLSTPWNWESAAEMDEITSWYVDFLAECLLGGANGPLIRGVGHTDGAMEDFISALQQYLLQSRYGEALMSLSGSDNQMFIVASKKGRRRYQRLLARGGAAARETERHLRDLIKGAVIFLTGGSVTPKQASGRGAKILN